MPYSLNSYTEEEKEKLNILFDKYTTKEIALQLNMNENKIRQYYRLTGLNKQKKKSNYNTELYKGSLNDFRDIPDYPNYKINEEGIVVNKNNLNIITPHILEDGYVEVRLSNEKGRKAFRLNRLVASVFLVNDDPLNKIEVDHIDGDIKNNNKNNLEWITPKENNERKIKRRKEQNKRVNGQSSRNLSDEVVNEVCKRLELKENSSVIIDYMVKVTDKDRKKCTKILGNIRNRKIYNHITKNYKY